MRSTIGATWGVGSSLDIRESTASTAGLGSPCLYSGSGSVLEARNLVCDAMQAPFLVMDATRGGRSKARGPTVFLDGVDGSAGRLAAVLIFSNLSSAVSSTLPVVNVTTKAKATTTVTATIWANTTTTTTTRPKSTTMGAATAKSTAVSTTKTNGSQPSAKAKEVVGLAQDQLHSPARVVIKDSEIRMKDTAVAGIWIGNSWASVTISRSSLVLDDDAVAGSSRVLIRAGGSGPTRGMVGFTEEPHRPQQRQRQPHVIRAEESTLEGDVLAAGDGSWVHLRVMNGSTWVGTAAQSGEGSMVDVSLTATSSWTMTGDAHVRRLRLGGDVPNIDSRGFILYYNATISGMAGTFDLPGGGRAVAVDM
ncbi:hypothetical protein MAPG_02198 [Magnaporthiopsis poae ATCC 64411]|uniref:Uncharacterized protein n=1 Tax=Magnaporthiopsis poae (strain ATCC 64411 / 73-15) TaxID=644358 RepID=A0A0C4DQQ2_MAGP6|nr:hypothetical protein MAPG_02198 [Magnaporthiopsis poae ATCC 64411]